MSLRRAAICAFLIIAAAAAIELAMGRHPICTCGSVELWVGSRDSPKTSQMLADWYSLSHIVHGLLFYALLWLLMRRSTISWRFVTALLIEVSWEVVENTPFVIDRYRETAAALGYSGDTVLNSVSDMLMMCIGFLAARKLPLWTSLLLLVSLEVVPLFVIRDNLTLNVWNLLAPNPAIQAWQAR
ncbi:MAG TPA: DUF2585 family protein [Sphingomicrobium sp.]|jgi:hypothetical protein|nr:DUF2585 family protein [Sphingomicrobium sp.]